MAAAQLLVLALSLSRGRRVVRRGRERGPRAGRCSRATSRLRLGPPDVPLDRARSARVARGGRVKVDGRRRGRPGPGGGCRRRCVRGVLARRGHGSTVERRRQHAAEPVGAYRRWWRRLGVYSWGLGAAAAMCVVHNNQNDRDDGSRGGDTNACLGALHLLVHGTLHVGWRCVS